VIGDANRVSAGLQSDLAGALRHAVRAIVADDELVADVERRAIVRFGREGVYGRHWNRDIAREDGADFVRPAAAGERAAGGGVIDRGDDLGGVWLTKGVIRQGVGRIVEVVIFGVDAGRDPARCGDHLFREAGAGDARNQAGRAAAFVKFDADLMLADRQNNAAAYFSHAMRAIIVDDAGAVDVERGAVIRFGVKGVRSRGGDAEAAGEDGAEVVGPAAAGEVAAGGRVVHGGDSLGGIGH